MQQLIDDLQQAIEKQPGDAAQLPAVLAALRTLRNAISAWQGEPTACRTAIYTAQFDAFWRAYPAGRKVGKGKAFASWQRAIAAGTDADTIITAAEQYAASGVGRGEFVRMPATWLNQQCWLDDREAWEQQQKQQDLSVFL